MAKLTNQQQQDALAAFTASPEFLALPAGKDRYNAYVQAYNAVAGESMPTAGSGLFQNIPGQSKLETTLTRIVGGVAAGITVGGLVAGAAGGAGGGGTAAAGSAVGASVGSKALPLLLAGVSVAGDLYKAYTDASAGDAAKAAGDFNANVAETQAKQTIAQGDDLAAQYGQQGRALIGTEKAAYAGQNVDVGTGSPVDVQASTTYQVALDQQHIKLNAARAAWGYQVQAQNDRMQGANVQSADTGAAYSTILGGVGDVAGIAAKYGFGRTSTAPATYASGPANFVAMGTGY